MGLTVAAGELQHPKWKTDQLYREVAPAEVKSINIKLVPYFAWGNRGDTDMSVWIPVR